jgi:hypothetical protein
LVVGCGKSGHTTCGDEVGHPGRHAQADTLDLSRDRDPDLIGSILCETLPHDLARRYKSIMLEGLPPALYAEAQLYKNLSFLRARDSSITFLSVPSDAVTPFLRHCVHMQKFEDGWLLKPITHMDEIPPGLRIDDDYEKHLAPTLKLGANVFLAS